MEPAAWSVMDFDSYAVIASGFATREEAIEYAESPHRSTGFEIVLVELWCKTVWVSCDI